MNLTFIGFNNVKISFNIFSYLLNYNLFKKLFLLQIQ